MPEPQLTKQLLRDNFRLEVSSDVISGMDVEQVGMNVRVKSGDSRSNRARDIRLPHFVTNDDDTDAGRRTICQQAKRQKHRQAKISRSGKYVLTSNLSARPNW